MKPSSYVYLARIAYMHSMHERKVYKENETRVNTLLNQFTYKLKERNNKNKKHKKRQNRTQQIYLTYLIWKEKRKKHTGDAFET